MDINHNNNNNKFGNFKLSVLNYKFGHCETLERRTEYS